MPWWKRPRSIGLGALWRGVRTEDPQHSPSNQDLGGSYSSLWAPAGPQQWGLRGGPCEGENEPHSTRSASSDLPSVGHRSKRGDTVCPKPFLLRIIKIPPMSRFSWTLLNPERDGRNMGILILTGQVRKLRHREPVLRKKLKKEPTPCSLSYHAGTRTRVDNSHAVTNCHTCPLPGLSLPLQLLPGTPAPCPSHHEHLTGEGVDEVRDGGTRLSPAVRLIMGCLARHRGCVHRLPSCGQPGGGGNPNECRSGGGLGWAPWPGWQRHVL